MVYDGMLGNLSRTTANAAMLARSQKKNADEASGIRNTSAGYI
jgi:hypothetical protein